MINQSRSCTMRHVIRVLVLSFALQLTILGLSQNTALAKAVNQRKTNENQLFERIDFGNSYILGQTIKSGAVYLLKRKKSEIESMLKCRENYREEILDSRIDQIRFRGKSDCVVGKV